MTRDSRFWGAGMAPDDQLLKVLREAYEHEPYPEMFLGQYVPMACLAERPGIDTLLVQDAEGSSFVAKCYDKAVWEIQGNEQLLKGLEHEGLPRYVGSFEDERSLVTVRTYVEGITLERYAEERELGEQDIVGICVQLCDILAYLHHREEPIIHRDIKPANVVVRDDGTLALIDFDIARVYHQGSETDTRFFGTQAYAPPEQYGFAQTDARADIYALGVLLRWLLTGSARPNGNVRVYRPLAKIIDGCTAFSPNERFGDVDQVRRLLVQANPTSQRRRVAGVAIGALAVTGALALGGVALYRHLTYSPFTSDAIPAAIPDEDRVEDAVAYLREKYGTDLFDQTDDLATFGLVRAALMELYGFDHDYVYGSCPEVVPQEGDGWFIPWSYGDEQTVDRDTLVYVAVKAHDPELVADWSILKDDDGYYPGVRVAMLFADRYDITRGVGRPKDILVGEAAIIIANTDRVFEAAEGQKGL